MGTTTAGITRRPAGSRTGSPATASSLGGGAGRRAHHEEGGEEGAAQVPRLHDRVSFVVVAAFRRRTPSIGSGERMDGRLEITARTLSIDRERGEPGVAVEVGRCAAA